MIYVIVTPHFQVHPDMGGNGECCKDHLKVGHGDDDKIRNQQGLPSFVHSSESCQKIQKGTLSGPKVPHSDLEMMGRIRGIMPK